MTLHPWRPKPELPSPWHHYVDEESTGYHYAENIRFWGGELIVLGDGEEEPPQDLELAERMEPGSTD